MGDSENYSTIDTHKVVEQKYWALQLDSIAQGDTKIDASEYKAVIDSGTSLLVGPKKIVDPLIKGIKVPKTCKGIEDLPRWTKRMPPWCSIHGLPRGLQLLHPW